MVGILVSRVHDLFNNPSLRSLLLKARKPLGLLACALLISQINPDWFLPGVLVSVAGALLQLWCFGSLKTNKILADRGPYSLVRNPMYLARYLLIFGAILFTGNVWIVLLYSLGYYFYMVNRVQREEKKLGSVFGQTYLDYCARVQRFVPSLRHFKWTRIWFFRWEFFMRNHGLTNLAVVFVFYGVCYYFAFTR
ncbi:MAG: isoprenylcysteine carboxylmethyltransferase family protein [Planctomycetota bacterium]